jgi:GTP-binding protein HflX
VQDRRWRAGGSGPEVPIETLHGNRDGLKPSESKALLALYQRRMPANRFLTPEVARRLTEVSRETGRQVGLLVDRRGQVVYVIVGDAHRLFIPDLSRHRAGAGRFRGLRLLHTHLRGESLSRDDLTDLTLLQLDAVVMVQAGLDGLPGAVEWAMLNPGAQAERGEAAHTQEARADVYNWEEDFRSLVEQREAALARRDATRRVDGGESCLVVGVTTGPATSAHASLDELERLCDTAGLLVVDRVLQVRRQVDGRFVIGEGKLQEVLVRAMQLGAHALVFDQELSPSQLRNVAEATELKVLDRTQVILDIFARRAKTREGKLQVELAQLRYRKPRLAIMPTAMSRLTGGIGGVGPGETKLEINRRRADERETRLERELKDLEKHRALRRKSRDKAGLPGVAIVGYTNAGKSTLLNAMTNASVDAEDKLFATLDPTSRRLRFPEHREIILTDTVGFIRNLPKDLIHAFRSTLEEAKEAELILHVMDASSPEVDVHKLEVEKTLERIGAEAIPRMLVLNKVDAVDPALWSALRERYGGLLVSARSREGLDALLGEIERRLFLQRADGEGESGLHLVSEVGEE